MYIARTAHKIYSTTCPTINTTDNCFGGPYYKLARKQNTTLRRS